MIIQSLSIVIPAKCPNNCYFCVSHMNQLNQSLQPHKDDGIWKEIELRMNFARDNDCNTLVLTSYGETLNNLFYIEKILEINKSLQKPFRWIEVQTSGVFKDNINNRTKTLNDADMFNYSPCNNISTISLSVVDIFNDLNNIRIMRIPKLETGYHLELICENIKLIFEKNLRLSINLTYLLNNKYPDEIFRRLKELNVDQVTFRELYSEKNSKQSNWIEKNKIDDRSLNNILTYIKDNGKPLEKLPFGATRYSIDGISTVLDNDCMNQNVNSESLRYLILRPNGKLYSRWDDEGSLIF